MSILNNSALCNLTDVKNFSSIEFDKVDFQVDNVIINLISSVSLRFEKYCGRKFNKQTYTEYHNGFDKYFLYTNQYPILQVIGLYEDSNWEWEEDTIFSTNKYKISNDKRRILLKNGRFSISCNENIKIIYEAGYEEIPEDLKQACIEEVSKSLNMRKDVHISSKSLNDGSVERFQTEFLPSTKLILDLYRNYGIV